MTRDFNAVQVTINEKDTNVRILEFAKYFFDSVSYTKMSTYYINLKYIKVW